VAILAALEIVERTSGNEVFARAVRAAGDSVRGGETLADPLARSGEFPAMVTRMIGVGEKTGALETMLSKISDFFDSEVKASIDGLTSMIEPILILMMGIVVAASSLVCSCRSCSFRTSFSSSRREKQTSARGRQRRLAAGPSFFVNAERSFFNKTFLPQKNAKNTRENHQATLNRTTGQGRFHLHVFDL